MVLSMMRWRGKVAIVTGASSGIGAAIVEKLVNEGMVVVGLARRRERLQALAARLQGLPGQLHPLPTDVTQEPELVASFHWTEEHLGAVHVLVNAAGVLPSSPLHEADAASLRATLDTNVLAAALVAREAVASMRRHGVDGHIVNVGSIAGHYPVRSPGLYAASKHALRALTETLRQELQVSLKTGIKVTEISPGAVMTEMFQQACSMRPNLPELPHLSAEDIADSVQYALSTPPHVQVHEIIIRPVGEYI